MINPDRWFEYYCGGVVIAAMLFGEIPIAVVVFVLMVVVFAKHTYPKK